MEWAPKCMNLPLNHDFVLGYWIFGGIIKVWCRILQGKLRSYSGKKKVIFRIPPPSDEANSTETFPVGHPGLQSTNLAPVRKPGLRGSSVPPETKKLLKLWKNPTPKTSGTGHSPSLEDSRETHHLPHVSMALWGWDTKSMEINSCGNIGDLHFYLFAKAFFHALVCI